MTVTMSDSQNLRLEIPLVDSYGLLRPYLLACLGVFLLFWLATKSAVSCSSHNPLTLFWSFCRTILASVIDSIETATTGSLSPPISDQLPGPHGLPFIGYLPFIGKLPHLSLARVAQRYGGRMFRLAAGCRRYVVISRLETVRELARRYPQELRGKPRTFTTEQVCQRSNKLSCLLNAIDNYY